MKSLPLLFAAVLILPAALRAQSCITPQYVAGFENDPHDPVRSIPIHGSDGALYFTTNKGGWADDGALVKLMPDGTRITLVNFDRLNKDRTPQAEPIGYLPETGVIEGPDGALYGTTQNGGNSTIGVSTVFRCTKAGVYTTLGYLPGGGGVTPSRLTLGSDGNFYGVTTFGGTGNGMLFRVVPNSPGVYTSCTITVVKQFTGPAAGITELEGRYPKGPLVERTDSGTATLYGVLAESGTTVPSTGRVFRFALPHGSTPITLVNVGRLTGVGSLPEAGLTKTPDGVLYGTVSTSASGRGAVYRINAAFNIATVLDFSNTFFDPGYAPNTPVLVGSDGFLYGGNSSDGGHIWRMGTEGQDARPIWSFSGGVGGDGEDATGLVQRPDGSIWGLTAAGGLEGRGTLFSLTGSGRNWGHTVVWRMGLRVVAAEGAYPVGGLVSDGSLLYGTTEQGGSLDNNGNGYGTIFSVNFTTGQKTTLFSFRNAPGAPGFWPRATLLRRADGWFYGTTSAGGQAPFAGGTVFKWRPAAGINPMQFTTLAQFNGLSASGLYAAGSEPESALCDGGDGYLYGTTKAGGANGFGTIYRIPLAGGALQTLVQFTGVGGSAPGKQPIGGLVRRDASGQSLLWGATYGGGATQDYGTVYSYNMVSGAFTLRHNFTDNVNGYGPQCTLLPHKGLLYGTCKFGGGGGMGTVWTINPVTHALTLVHTFNRIGPPARFASYPLAGLTVGPDGALYGTTSESYGHFQPGNYGNLFRISSTGLYSQIGTFTGFPAPLTPSLAGENPQHHAMCLGPDGMLYGTARTGGPGFGSIFRINPGPLVYSYTPRVISTSSVTATGFINPNGTPCERSIEIVNTTDYATGGTPARLTVFELPTTAPGSFSINFTGLTANADYAVRTVATTASCGEVFGEWVFFRITGRSLWQSQQFGVNAGNASIGGLTADPDGDGANNLLEWMRDTSPFVSNSLPFPYWTDFGDSQLTRMTWNIGRPLDGDEWLLLETSPNLTAWYPMGDGYYDAASGSPAAVTGFYFLYGRGFFRTSGGLKGWERIPTLFNTGVDLNRQPLPDNYVDPYWQSARMGNPYGFAYARTSQIGVPIAPAGGWLGDNNASRWISVSPDFQANRGDYLYKTTFVIPWGVDVRTVAIALRFANDDEVWQVDLNGQTVGVRANFNASAFGPEILLTRGFVTGRNTLEFTLSEAFGNAVAQGGGGYTGLRVEMDGTMARAGRVAIPGLMNSGCQELDGPPRTNNQTVPGVKVFKPGESVPVTPVVHTYAGGWPVEPGAWFYETYASAWMKPDTTISHPAGDYHWTREFDLTGLDPSSVEIRGRVASDDGVTIFLNGSHVIPAAGVNYAGWTPFEMSPQLRSLLQPGVNSLVFRVNNGAFAGNNPSGLRYEFLQATASPLP